MCLFITVLWIELKYQYVFVVLVGLSHLESLCIVLSKATTVPRQSPSSSVRLFMWLCLQDWKAMQNLGLLMCCQLQTLCWRKRKNILLLSLLVRLRYVRATLLEFHFLAALFLPVIEMICTPTWLRYMSQPIWKNSLYWIKQKCMQRFAAKGLVQP